MKSVVDRIKTLVELRDKGSISKEEFDQMLALLEQELHRENKDASALNADRVPQNIESSGKRKIVLIVSVAGMLILFVLSFFTMVPAFLWDSDGDGFHNYRNDNCPAVSGTCQGCLDSDKDGFVDSEDECPKESSTTCKGCPDSDNDGVADKADNCVNEPGSPNCSGCPDKDSDGVSDSLDQCPEEKGVKINQGCPETQAPPTMDDIPKPKPEKPKGPKPPKVPEPKEFNLSAEIIHKKLNFHTDFELIADDIYNDLIKGKIPNVSIVSIVEEPTKNSNNEITTVILKIKIRSTKYRAAFNQDGLKLQNYNNNHHIKAVWNNRDLTTRPFTSIEKKEIKSNSRLAFDIQLLGGEKFIMQND
jgi:hypothetical protein